MLSSFTKLFIYNLVNQKIEKLQDLYTQQITGSPNLEYRNNVYSV